MDQSNAFLSQLAAALAACRCPLASCRHRCCCCWSFAKVRRWGFLWFRCTSAFCFWGKYLLTEASRYLLCYCLHSLLSFRLLAYLCVFVCDRCCQQRHSSCEIESRILAIFKLAKPRRMSPSPSQVHWPIQSGNESLVFWSFFQETVPPCFLSRPNWFFVPLFSLFVEDLWDVCRCDLVLHKWKLINWIWIWIECRLFFSYS